MRRTRSALPFVLLTALAGLVLGISPADAKPQVGKGKKAAAVTWAPADQATITPGSEMITDGSQCTANFIYTDGADVLIGYAAHCAGDGGAATDTNGCEAPSLPTGSTQVEIEGASKPGTLVYSSWETMQAGRRDRRRRLQPQRLRPRPHRPGRRRQGEPVHPPLGRPHRVEHHRHRTPARRSTATGTPACASASGRCRPRPAWGSARRAAGGPTPSTPCTPGIPGDSGSALLDAEGRGAGVLSTLAIAPLAGSNNYSDLASVLEYMRSHGGPQASLALGTEAFDGNQLPLDLGL